MRAVTIAAAGAALLGTVSASSHVQQVHKHLHARSWGDWESSADGPSTPADLTKTSEDEPKITPTPEYSDKPVDGDTTTPAEESTWADWSSDSSPVEITSTKTPDPTTSESYTVTWEDWSSSSPVEITSTKTPDPSSSETYTWEDWSSSSPVEITSTYDDPTTWEDWSTSSPVEITSTSYADPSITWGDWAESTVVKSGTTTTTIYLGKPTDPATETWEDWSSTSTDPAPTTNIYTTVWGDWSSYSTPASETTSSAPAWSSDGWFGPGWGASDGQCAIQVVTSYGSATWAPSPDTSLPVLSVTVSPTEPAGETGTTTWADWSATYSDPAVETSTSTETWADWSSTYSDPAVETSTTTWADWSATSSDPAVETSTSTETWADWSASPTGLGSSGNVWGLTYSPYTSEGGCKDADTVAKDLAIIKGKGFSTVRVYSTDCSTLENVGKSARDNGLKLILGVFISSTGIEGSKEQVWDIVGWAQWDLVELIVIGNEAVFNGYSSAKDLADYITESAGYFKQYGYTGPVTTTEPLAEWLKDGSTFYPVVDVIAANLYAFFNSEVTADKAGDFIQKQIDELSTAYPGKDTYVMESGWPNAGNCNGAACPSPENQATALKSIEEVTGSKVIFFSYEDEAWKAPGEFDVEQHWGCVNVF